MISVRHHERTRPEAVAWIDNLADKDWISEESNPNGIVYYGKPRQFGVEMTYRFSSFPERRGVKGYRAANASSAAKRARQQP